MNEMSSDKIKTYSDCLQNIITGWFEILIAYVFSYALTLVLKILHGVLKCCNYYYMVSALTAM